MCRSWFFLLEGVRHRPPGPSLPQHGSDVQGRWWDPAPLGDDSQSAIFLRGTVQECVLREQELGGMLGARSAFSLCNKPYVLIPKPTVTEAPRSLSLPMCLRSAEAAKPSVSREAGARNNSSPASFVLLSFLSQGLGGTEKLENECQPDMKLRRAIFAGGMS